MSLPVDEGILQEFLQLFGSYNVPDSNVQAQVYEHLNNIIESLPTFYIYFITIASAPTYGFRHRFLALALLRRYHTQVPEDGRELFLRFVNELIVRIFEEGGQLISQAAILMADIGCFYFINFNMNVIPNLVGMTMQLLSNPNTVMAGLDVLIELTAKKMPLSDDFLRTIQFLLGTDCVNSLSKSIFTILRNILSGYPESEPYLQNAILPQILTNFQSFSLDGLSSALFIASVFYVKTGDAVLAQFIAGCSTIDDADVVLNDSLDYFSECQQIPVSSELAIMLFNGLLYQSGDPVSDQNQINFSDLCLMALKSMVNTNGNAVAEILLPCISQCQNPSQILNAVNALCEQDNSAALTETFIGFVVSHLEDEFRGEACLCLGQMAGNQPSIVDNVITAVLPLLADQDPTVTDQAIFVLTELFAAKHFTPSTERFGMLITAFANVNETDRYSLCNAIIAFIDSVTDFSDPIYGTFLNQVLSEFVKPFNEQDVFASTPFIFLAKLIVSFTEKLHPAYTQDNINAIIGQIIKLLSLSQADSLSLCILVRTLLHGYNQFVLPHLPAIEGALNSFMMDYCQTMNFVDGVLWDLISDFLKINGFAQQCALKWVRFAIHQMDKATEMLEISPIISCWTNYLSNLPIEETNHFAIVVIRKFFSGVEEPNLLTFLEQIMQVMKAQGGLEPQIIQAYQQMKQKLSP